MNFLNVAIKAHQANDLVVAEGHYKKHLLSFPKDANAKQLLGLVYCANQNFVEARQALQESLTINPKQPHVHTNLGICLQQLGNTTQAVDCFKAAIKLASGYIEAYRNLALCYQSVSQYSQALEVLAQGLKQASSDIKLLKLQANIANQLENYPLAISALQKVVKLQPETIASRHNLGVLLRLNGQSSLALEQYLIVEKRGLNNYKLKHNMANVYADLAQLEKAVVYYKQSITLNPGYVEAHKNLNDLLWELNEQKEYLVSYQNAMLVEPQNEELHFAYARSLLLTSHYQQALIFLQQLKDSFKQSAEYFDLIGLSLIRLGHKKEALPSQKEAAGEQPINSVYVNNYARNLIETGNIDLAIEQLQGALKFDPDDQMAIAYLATCWRILGDEKEADINNYDELVKEYQFGALGGFKDITSFCADLKAYLDTLHTAKKQPLQQTLMNGTQTKGNLFDNKNELIQLLVTEITKCIKDYNQQISSVPHINPDLKELDDFYFSGSFSILLTEQGFHVSHVHPMGRLSLCFYVDVPDIVHKDVNKQGWLHLGEPNLDIQPKLNAVRFVEPKVGKLLIFPSFMWHGTRPFETPESRTTVVCDIMPCSKSNRCSIH